ncbi:MAG: agmatine deiminase family protein [Planctomycetota bacterium]
MGTPRVPADWEKQRSIWIAWPHEHETWPGRFEAIPGFFRDLAGKIAESTTVNVVGDPSLRKQLEPLPRNVVWHPIATDDCWIRDYGPTFVVRGNQRHAAIDWRYNAWGGKYDRWERDDAVAEKVAQISSWKRARSPLCLEGGALEHDGNRTLLTTSACLVTPNRNPGWSREQIRAELTATVGCQEIVWVDGGGLAGDDTDGHIDQLARFVDPQTIVVASCDDSSDENAAGLAENADILRRWAERRKPTTRVVSLPIPPKRTIRGQRVPESYCNFLRLGRDRILVPSFGDAASDDRARSLLRELASDLSPNVEVTSVDCRDLVWGLGSLHCASCNEPEATCNEPEATCNEPEATCNEPEATCNEPEADHNDLDP